MRERLPRWARRISTPSSAAELEGHARFAKVNTDEAPELAMRHGIRSIPTLLLLRGGREISRVSGAMDARSLARWVSQHI